MVGIDLTGRNVLITGGASGIGKASAKSFAASGARVAVTDIDRDGIQETVRGLGNEHFAICFPNDMFFKFWVARCFNCFVDVLRRFLSLRA